MPRSDIVNMSVPEAKEAKSTSLNNTTARETKSHVSAENTLGRYFPSGVKKGPLGARTGQG